MYRSVLAGFSDAQHCVHLCVYVHKSTEVNKQDHDCKQQVNKQWDHDCKQQVNKQWDHNCKQQVNKQWDHDCKQHVNKVEIMTIVDFGEVGSLGPAKEILKDLTFISNKLN
jgi:hypothetical protein